MNGMFQDVLIIPMVGSVMFFLAGLMRGVKANLAGQHKLIAEESVRDRPTMSSNQLVWQS
jgi:hypothetical protein